MFGDVADDKNEGSLMSARTTGEHHPGVEHRVPMEGRRARGNPNRRVLQVLAVAFALMVGGMTAGAASPAVASTGPAPTVLAAATCTAGQIPAAVPTQSSGRAAVRTTIGVAKTMGVPVKGQIIAVMVMYQESSIRNLANDGTSVQSTYWSSPGKAYWMAVTKLSLTLPHDPFGYYDGAHDTDSIGLYQQRPSSGWGNYGVSTGLTDPAAVVKRLLDPRWEAMAFFGGPRSPVPARGLLDVANWQTMSLTGAANAVQGSNYPDAYAKWEAPATKYVKDNQDAPAISLPWSAAGPSSTACTTPLVISLRARVNNRFVSADRAGAAALIANRTVVGTWEKFDLVSLGYTTVALRARVNNRYVTATNAGAAPLIANSGVVGDWTRFTLISNTDGSISLRAQINYDVVCAERAGTKPLIANRTAIGPWEKFDLVNG